MRETIPAQSRTFLIILIYTLFLIFVLPFRLIYFETDARQTNLLTLLAFLFYRSRTTIFADVNLRNFLESAILLFPNIRDPSENFMSQRKAKNLNIRRTNIN